MTREALMRKAIELSKENVENGGGPFGAVIATKRWSDYRCTGVNRVTTSCDPTAHAELVRYVPQLPNSEHLILADTKSILPANLAPCAWVLFTGRDWIRCTTVTTKPTPKISVLTILFYLRRTGTEARRQKASFRNFTTQ